MRTVKLALMVSVFMGLVLADISHVAPTPLADITTASALR